ncbi:MAG: phage holin family protein [Candidatus Moranbacteria bacterium]|nr:phage holin family protein [Candidatus Moranbacteria bacterium]
MELLILKLLITALAVLIIALIVPDIKVKGFVSALLVSLGIALVNIFLKPLIMNFIPASGEVIFIVITFIINALFIMLLALLVPGFKVKSFWSALLFSLIFVLFNHFFPRYIIDL